MALILNLETGTGICSAVLADGNKVLAERTGSIGNDHSRSLAPYISEIMDEAGFGMKDLDAVAVGKGPGSYTGLRIGVSTAKGLCFGLGVPLIGINSLDSLCRVALDGYREHFNDGSVLWCPMIDARRMEVYTAVYDGDGNALTPTEAVVVDGDSFREFFLAGKKLVLFGDGANKCRAVLPGEVTFYPEVSPSARGMVGYSVRAYEDGVFEDTAYFEPYYLKDYVVKKSQKKLF